MGATKRQSAAKREHSVSRFVLKRFASEREQLYVYDKVERRRLGLVHIKNVAVVGGFYDFSAEVQAELLSRVESGDIPQSNKEMIKAALNPQMIEDHLSDLEGKHAEAVAQLLKAVDEKARISPIHRQILADFLVVQRMRTPAFRDTLISGWKAAASGEQMSIDGKPLGFSPPPLNETQYELVHAAAFLSPDIRQEAVEMLISEVWRIGLNDTSLELYTSDDPVIMVDTLGDGAGRLSSLGARIIYPLTPRRLLVIFKQGIVAESRSMSLSEFNLSERDVAEVNRSQVMNCSRHVCCSSDQFDLAERVAKELPASR